MKKFLSTLAIGLFALVLASCGNDPESVVKKALNAMLDGDGETFTECVYFDEDVYDSDSKLERAKKTMVRKIEKEAKRMEKRDEDRQIDKFEIIDTEYDDDDEDYATVTVKAYFKDGHTDKDDFRLLRDPVTEEWKLIWYK